MEKFFDMPLKGAGAVNDFCKNARQQDPDKDGRRAGFLMTYGKFKFLDLGDLTWSKEMELACPVNKIGTNYRVSGIGDTSGAPAHVLALAPQVIVAEITELRRD
jgi:hypothetical protein